MLMTWRWWKVTPAFHRTSKLGKEPLRKGYISVARARYIAPSIRYMDTSRYSIKRSLYNSSLKLSPLLFQDKKKDTTVTRNTSSFVSSYLDSTDIVYKEITIKDLQVFDSILCEQQQQQEEENEGNYVETTKKQQGKIYVHEENEYFFGSAMSSENKKKFKCVQMLSESAMKEYTRDWTGKWGDSKNQNHNENRKKQIILLPTCTKDISKILSYCNEESIGVVPQGGNTGLVGGSIPIKQEIVLSLKLLKSIHYFDPVSGILVCDSGCILEELSNKIYKYGYIMPLDLGAKGSCQIGGNISTNAGGLRYLRYGSLHGSVTGLEVVLADGRILNMTNTMRKDNTGYHLYHLMIGGEGTLGVITKVCLQLPPLSSSRQICLLGTTSFVKVKEIMVKAKRQLGEILSAIELMDHFSLQPVFESMPKEDTRKQLLFESEYPFYVLIETSGSNEVHDQEKLNNFLENCMIEEVISDGIIAQDYTQQQQLWSLRENVPVAMADKYRVHKYDVSLPMEFYYTIVEELREKLKSYPEIKVVGYGHLGDSNLHLNIAVPKDRPDPSELSNEEILKWVIEKKGSISAEHGLGQLKNEYLPQIKDENTLNMMKQLKLLFDPKRILNPYKYLPKG